MQLDRCFENGRAADQLWLARLAPLDSASRAPAGMRLWHSLGIWGNPLPPRCRHIAQRRQHRVGRTLGRDETKSV
jgi:hypothetical protein